MKIFIHSAVAMTALLSFAGIARGADVPDYVRLQDLAPETSIFLLSTFAFPADENALIDRSPGGHADTLSRRVDYFVDGNRVARETLAPGAAYCAIISASGAKEF